MIIRPHSIARAALALLGLALDLPAAPAMAEPCGWSARLGTASLPPLFYSAELELEQSSGPLSLGAEIFVPQPQQPEWNVWAVWGRWDTGWGFAPVVGIDGSAGMLPSVGIGRTPESPGVIVGVSRRWEAGRFWWRVSPSLVATPGDMNALGYSWRSFLAGPPWAEAGWRPTDHLEIGLRLALSPIALSYRF
jgi:hypothetical protein